MPVTRRLLLLWLLRLSTASALAVDAYVHVKDAGIYQQAQLAGSFTQSQLFWAEAGVAGVTAVLVLTWHRRGSWVAAALVAGSALGAVLASRYVHVGALGPMPDMYEPTWAVAGKLPSALTEAAAGILALAGLWVQQRAAGRTRTTRTLTRPS